MAPSEVMLRTGPTECCSTRRSRPMTSVAAPLDRLKTMFLQGCFWCATGSGAGDIRPQGTSVRPCCPETSLSVLLRLPWHVIEASSCPGLPPSPSPFRCQVCARVGSLPASSCFSPASRTASPLKYHLHIEPCLGGRDLLFRGS